MSLAMRMEVWMVFREIWISSTKKMVETTMNTTAVSSMVDFQTSKLRPERCSRIVTKTRMPEKAAEVVTARIAFFNRWLRS